MLRLVASLVPATTAVLSSHDLDEVEAICDSVGILEAVGFATRSHPRPDRGHRPVTVAHRDSPPADAIIAALGAASWISSASEVSPGVIEFSAINPDSVEVNIAGLPSACGAKVVSVAPARPAL